MANSKPTQMPGQGEESEAAAMGQQSEPMELGAAEMATTAETSSFTAPLLEPPIEEEQGFGAGVWVNNKRIDALWTIAENRNSWARVTGVGFKKLANGSDSGVVALTMLAAHARQLNRPVNYREEADKMIHEMYVW